MREAILLDGVVILHRQFRSCRDQLLYPLPACSADPIAAEAASVPVLGSAAVDRDNVSARWIETTGQVIVRNKAGPPTVRSRPIDGYRTVAGVTHGYEPRSLQANVAVLVGKTDVERWNYVQSQRVAELLPVARSVHWHERLEASIVPARSRPLTGWARRRAT